jgi:hypothetical protein
MLFLNDSADGGFIIDAYVRPMPGFCHRRVYRLVSRFVYSTTAIISISTIASG